MCVCIICAFIFYVFTHVCALGGRRDAVGVLTLSSCFSQACQGSWHRARAQARLWGKSPQQCHLLKALWLKPPWAQALLSSAALTEVHGH